MNEITKIYVYEQQKSTPPRNYHARIRASSSHNFNYIERIQYYIFLLGKNKFI